MRNFLVLFFLPFGIKTVTLQQKVASARNNIYMYMCVTSSFNGRKG